MQDRQTPDLGPEGLRVGRNPLERLGGGAEQEAVDDPLVLQGFVASSAERPGTPPSGSAGGRTGRGGLPPAIFLDDGPVAALVALLQVPAERGGAAGFVVSSAERSRWPASPAAGPATTPPAAPLG
jgi:hypothetical protein